MERPEIGPWSVVKNEILQEYAKTYLTIMLNQDWCKGVLYVDAFAGATENVERTTNAAVPGSSARALSLHPQFTDYFFFELDASRVADLNALTAEHDRAFVRQGDGNQLTKELIVPLLARHHFRRGLVFLDPYGLQLDWEVVHLLGETKSADVVINFPIMDINRNSVRKQESAIDDAGAARMTRLWGDETWRDQFYRPNPNLSLWGESSRIKSVTSDEIAHAYRDRLLIKGGYSHVTEPFLLRNVRGGPLYYILMASNKQTAVRIMNSIMKKYRNQLSARPQKLWTDE